MQCTNHLKQIGLAVHNFHDTRQGLPPVGFGSGAMGGAMRTTIWALILPFAEQQSLYDFLNTADSSIGSTTPVTGTWTDGTAAAGHEGLHSNFGNKWFHDIGQEQRNSIGSIPFMKCPTRRSGISILYPGNDTNDVTNSGYRNGPLGDYAAVLAIGNSQASPGPQWWGQCYHPVNHISNNVGPFRLPNYATQNNYASWQLRDTMAWWTDGTSNQLIVGEKHIPLGGVAIANPQRSGDCSFLSFSGGWPAMGAVRPLVFYRDSTTQLYWAARLRTPNEFQNPTSDIIFLDSEKALNFGSWHAGICNFLIGDGSVRSLAVTMATQTLANLAVVNDGNSVSF
ncbi:MAG: DUF1559 domain-containing protein [Planctomycetaceae bacterium]|jgi:hypothetical protein|nr:DUF1559 domain-containing protein [Planctomycetaceae bacterium]